MINSSFVRFVDTKCVWVFFGTCVIILHCLTSDGREGKDNLKVGRDNGHALWTRPPNNVYYFPYICNFSLISSIIENKTESCSLSNWFCDQLYIVKTEDHQGFNWWHVYRENIPPLSKQQGSFPNAALTLNIT